MSPQMAYIIIFMHIYFKFATKINKKPTETLLINVIISPIGKLNDNAGDKKRF